MSWSQTKPPPRHDRRGDGLCADHALYAAAAYETQQYHDDCNDQQNMDEAAHGVTAHQTEQPQHNEYNSDGLEHFFLSLSPNTGEHQLNRRTRLHHLMCKLPSAA